MESTTLVILLTIERRVIKMEIVEIKNPANAGFFKVLYLMQTINR